MKNGNPKFLFDIYKNKKDKFKVMADAYLYSAIKLLEQISPNDNEELDSICFPIFFMIQHSLELLFKSRIYEITGTLKNAKTHDIEKLILLTRDSVENFLNSVTNNDVYSLSVEFEDFYKKYKPMMQQESSRYTETSKWILTDVMQNGFEVDYHQLKKDLKILVKEYELLYTAVDVEKYEKKYHEW